MPVSIPPYSLDFSETLVKKLVKTNILVQEIDAITFSLVHHSSNANQNGLFRQNW